MENSLNEWRAEAAQDTAQDTALTSAPGTALSTPPTPLIDFVLAAVRRKPGIEGRDIRRPLRGKVKSKKVKCVIWWLLHTGQIRAQAVANPRSGKPKWRYYAAGRNS